jgi:hypothetical protein
MFKIQGSNDGVNYDDLQSYDVTWTSAGETRTFNIDNSITSYKYLRWMRTGQGAGQNQCGMAHCHIWGA